MRRMYIHERLDWPRFHWNQEALTNLLATVRYRQGRLSGRMAALDADFRQEALLQTLTEDVLQTSAIAGEALDAEQVRSSLARRLGIDIGGPDSVDRIVEGIARVTFDAMRCYRSPLTAERLRDWHASLFSAGPTVKQMAAGRWRDDHAAPMQAVSGSIGGERGHFEAPPAERIDREIAHFLDWFNASDDMDGVLKAALAHLWFVTIHPFDDGNGRIARAIADMALARSEQSPQRFYSMSSQIRKERTDYDRILEATRQGSMDVSVWMYWFLECLKRAMDGAETTLDAVLDKALFWERVEEFPLHERQRAMLARLLGGFQGKLTTSKWASMAKCSQDTALRDITELMEWGVLLRNPGGGRSVSYSLVDVGTSGDQARD